MRKVTRLAVVAAALPAALGACSGEKNAAPAPERPEVAVHTADVANRKVPAAEAYVGNIRSNEIVVIATKMMGRILALPVHEGDVVHTGQARGARRARSTRCSR
jgi:multidrug efflux pump subunit AcrA (membrane-fusion protein)